MGQTFAAAACGQKITSSNAATTRLEAAATYMAGCSCSDNPAMIAPAASSSKLHTDSPISGR